MKIDFTLNEKKTSIDIPPEKRLSDILREDFGLFLVKNACNTGSCGSCTVLVNGKPVPSCLVPAFSLRGAKVVTMEFFMKTRDYKDIADAFVKADCMPCPFCFSGRIFAVHSLLDSPGQPGEEEVMKLLADHSCSCTAVSSFMEGVRLAFINREINGGR